MPKQGHQGLTGAKVITFLETANQFKIIIWRTTPKDKSTIQKSENATQKELTTTQKDESTTQKDESTTQKDEITIQKDESTIQKNSKEFLKEDEEFRKGDEEFLKEGENTIRKNSKEFLKEDEDFRKEFLKAKEIIYSMILSKPDTTTGDMAAKIGVSDRQVRKYIKKLTDLGLLKREGGRKHGYWIVTDKDN